MRKTSTRLPERGTETPSHVQTKNPKSHIAMGTGNGVTSSSQKETDSENGVPYSVWAVIVILLEKISNLRARTFAALAIVVIMAGFAVWVSLPENTRRQLLTQFGLEATSTDKSQIAGEFYAEIEQTSSTEEADRLKDKMQQFADEAAAVNRRPDMRNTDWTYPRGVLFASSDVSVERSIDKTGNWIVAIDLLEKPETQIRAEDQLKDIQAGVYFFLENPAPDKNIQEDFKELLSKTNSARVRRYDPAVYQTLYHRELVSAKSGTPAEKESK